MAPSATTVTESYTTLSFDEQTLVDSVVAYTEHEAKLDDRGSTALVANALREQVKDIDHHHCDAGEEDAFFVADLGEVYRQHLRWKLNLKRVKPFYGELLFGVLSSSAYLANDTEQPSNAIPINGCFVYWRSLAPDSTVRQSKRFSRFSKWESIHLESSMLSHARPSHSSAMPPSVA